MTEGYSNIISEQNTSSQPNMGDKTCLEGTTQLSNRVGLDNVKKRYISRPSISLDSNALKKLTKIWEVNPSNLASFMKLDPIERIPKLKSKSQSVRIRRCSNKIQPDRKLSRGLTEAG